MDFDQQLAVLDRDARAFAGRVDAARREMRAFGQRIADAKEMLVTADRGPGADALAALASPQPE